jgi:hypothetical protein
VTPEFGEPAVLPIGERKVFVHADVASIAFKTIRNTWPTQALAIIAEGFSILPANAAKTPADKPPVTPGMRENTGGQAASGTRHVQILRIERPWIIAVGCS